MTPARNLQLFPTKPPRLGKGSKGYTKLDNEADMDVLFSLPNALLKPALFLMSRRFLADPGATWVEVAAKISRSQQQTSAALAQLRDLGLAESRKGFWYWKPCTAIQGFSRKSCMEQAEKNGQDGIPALRTKRTKFNEVEEGVAHPAESAEQTNTTPQGGQERTQSPDGAAPDGARPASPSQDQLSTAQGNGGDEHAMGIERGSAGARAAMQIIAGAGLMDLWRDWARLVNVRPVTLEAQARRWAEWIQDGHGLALQTQAAYIVEAGYYENPAAALRKRMLDAQQAPAPLPAVPVSERPALRAGQRVRYPDGTEAVILSTAARGITTDHPDLPDVPLGRLKTLEVIA